MTILGGAGVEPSRKPWRRAPAKLGRVSALHDMKLLPSRRTAMGETTGAAAVGAGGAITGPATVASDRAEEVAGVVIAAAAAWVRSGSGGRMR